MVKLKKYRQTIRQVLNEYVRLANQNRSSSVESFLIADEDGDNYIWMDWGWKDEEERVKKIQVYVRLRDGKFWIEEDWTEEGIATDLLEAGVPREDIVLAFQPPEMRKYTEFAAA